MNENNRSKSKNTRDANIKMREKFSVRMPNSVKEVLIINKINGDAKCQDTMDKELEALERMKA